MDISIGNQNAITKRFNFVRAASGDVSFDDTQAHAVVTSAMEKLGGYWADPTHGGELWTMSNATARAPSQAEAFVNASLDSLVRDGSIAAPTVAASLVRTDGINGLIAHTSWTTPSGASPSVKIPA